MRPDLLLPGTAVLLLIACLALLVVLVRRGAGGGTLAARLDAFERAQERTERALREAMDRARDDGERHAGRFREEVGATLAAFQQSVVRTMAELSATQRRDLDGVSARTAADLERLRATVEERLERIRADNAARLEQVRQTVDEKLQGVLEQRLGESFRLVSERLEQVHRGLGEMQALASGVGDLKRVLANVKVRGTWGEVQLGTLLAQVLAPEQYVANALPNEYTGHRVEFAIRLPGSDLGQVLLPIDAKFPLEDYQRLLDAHDRADPAAVEEASRALEARVRACARDVSSKYLNPPVTTDFALLFLPMEGLYAEVVRRPGLADALQREHRVVVAGPATLWAILNSLQMGFRTLAIQQRSGEVWAVLGAVKTEFGKFGAVLEKVKRKLQEATNQMDAAGVRTRAIERKLLAVEALPSDDPRVLALGDGPPPLPAALAADDD